MEGFLEPIVQTLRVGLVCKRHGDDFVGSATIRHLSPTRVEVVGWSCKVPMTLEIRRAIEKTLIDGGITSAFYTRIRKDGTRKLFEFWI